ncbi:hypothetical protein V7114_18305 [Neobacillus niacini]|uniref:hypothetical protein n=1 Tax=Neobacillus niacini TaxID=86668 RepID=UPI0030008662
MKDPFAKFQKERDEKIIQSVFDAIQMLGEKTPEEDIQKETGLQKEYIQKLKRILKGADSV